MEARTKKILGISAAIVGVIFIILYFYKRAQKKALENSLNSGSSNSGSGTPITSGSIPVTPGISAYHGTDYTRWNVNDGLKSLSNIVNIYSGALASSSSIDKTIAANSEIGFIVERVGSFVKVKYPDTFLGYPTIKTGYVFVSQVSSPGSPNVTN